MADKVLQLINGLPTEVEATQESAGAGDAGKVLALNADGLVDDTALNSTTSSSGVGDADKVIKTNGSGVLDPTLLPAGVGADTKVRTASEALTAGNIVNIWNDTGTAKARKADATATGKRAVGFVLANVSSDNPATVYFEGTITGLTSLTPGATYFLDTTAGGITTSPPTGSGNVVQVVGVAISDTELSFEPGDVYVRA